MASGLINDGQCVVTIRSVGMVTPESLEVYMRDRIARLARLGWSFTHVAIELEHERNPRMADIAYRVQVTCRSPRLVVRAECCDSAAPAAFDACLERLHGRLRRMSDKERARRRGRYAHGNGNSPFVDMTVGGPAKESADSSAVTSRSSRAKDTAQQGYSAIETVASRVVRRKVHQWWPMTLEEAIDAMEMLGHSFYLFIDAQTHEPMVVYARKAFTYGVVKLGEEVKQRENVESQQNQLSTNEQVAA